MAEGGLHLIVVAAGRAFALPFADVREVLRPLAIEPAPGAPSVVLGLALVRGRPTPVVDLRELLGARASAAGRWVSLRAGDRPVALAVDAVVGIERLEGARLEATPPLATALEGGVVRAIGARDGALLAVLEASRLLDEARWEPPDAERDEAVRKRFEVRDG
jgi:purine-binding chemotaxis protein CheW